MKCLRYVRHNRLQSITFRADQLQRTDKPNPPVLDDIECTEKFATLRWHPTGENQATILRYTIEYITDFADTWDVASDFVPGLETSYTVALSPWANHTFRLIAHNKIGASVPSDRSAACTTLPDVPYKNPDNVEGRGTTPHNMVISWSVMPQLEHNGPGFYYMVSYRRHTTGETWYDNIIPDWRISELIVQHTPTYVPYHIKVFAYNSKGVSNAAPIEVVGWSGEDKPLLAPANFTLIEILSGTIAQFSWDPVPLESVRGRLLGYRIQIWIEGMRGSREVVVDGHTTKALVNVLEPYKRNKVRIMAYNSYDNSPYSELSFFTSPEQQ